MVTSAADFGDLQTKPNNAYLPLHKIPHQELKKLILKFLYVGENERPVQVLIFRHKENGGLGLVHPLLKSRSLFIKNMIIEFIERKLQVVNGELSEDMYGLNNEFYEFVNSGKKNLHSSYSRTCY